jgi:N-acetylglutamate synthase-like GNAT family acetyltransferase
MTTDIHEVVRERYAEAARSVLSGESCCAEDGNYGSDLYSALEREELPDAAVMASLGCGNPIAVADLHEGERVLDLGSGGGIDVLLSARRVGPTGRAFGLDMTDEMLALAQRNAATAGAMNVEFLKGHIEAIPLPAASIDVVISNCVVNLAADKPAVFREIARVLRPGGRIGITDIVADDSLTPEQRRALDSDRAAVEDLLTASELPLDGLEIALPTAVVARAEAAVVGCAAVEAYGSVGLLRSVVVTPDLRGTGLGRRLVEAAEALAAERGIAELYLLTETAKAWFPRLGYRPAARASVPAELTASPEFTTACPESALLLYKRL